VSVRPVTHYTWQVLRAVKRSKKPPTGRQLRLAPTRSTKDGTFLNALVEEGLLVRLTGSADAPFEATYGLTPLGQHAAEFGEYDHNLRPETSTPQPAPRSVEPSPKRNRSK
jgi:hypothetical protein